MNQNLTIRLFQISNGIQYLTSFICISIILFFKGTKIYGEFAILLQYAGVILSLFSLTPASVLKQFIILNSSVKNRRNYLHEIIDLMIQNIILFLVSMIINFFGYSFSMSLALSYSLLVLKFFNTSCI